MWRLPKNHSWAHCRRESNVVFGNAFKITLIRRNLFVFLQALSYAGRKLGIPITVLLPKLAPVSKVQTCRKYGSKVIVDGEDVHEAVIKAAELARNQNQKFINIFSNFALGVGNATAAIEMAQQVPKMDYCILPITLEKGILNGMKVAIKKLCPCCKIYVMSKMRLDIPISFSDLLEYDF